VYGQVARNGARRLELILAARLEENELPPNKLMEGIRGPRQYIAERRRQLMGASPMSTRVTAAAMDGIHALFHVGAMGNWTDGRLIDQFLTCQEGSEAAFRVLIHRHGPMVLGICRRVLGDEHAAEDAFQTTFLVLVKKAGVLRDCNLLTNWLYGVALRVASKDRAKGARRRIVERRAAERATEAKGDADQAELRSVIDEEIRRLPERYRVPLVLCHVEGLRHDEVARRIGCPVGTVESRLSRARERLRARLARRGLAPSAAALGAILRPPGAPAIVPSLVEATLRSAVELAAQQACVGTGMVSAWSWVKRTVGSTPTIHAGTVASTLIVCAGVALMGSVVYRAEGEPTRIDAADTRPQAISSPQASQAGAEDLNPHPQPGQRVAATPQPSPVGSRNQDEPIRPTRFPVAIAPALTGITIDGRLDDWPTNSRRYEIHNQLLGASGYESRERDAANEANPYFIAGFDPKAELIYLAVVVTDDVTVVHPTDARSTDAVEVYIDGNLSDQRIQHPSGDWNEVLDAATMPVLQYAGVPGKVRAYGDRWGANPSLVYAKTKETATRMKYQRVGDVTTYEWAIKPFDRFPERPTRLYPGKRLGLDVAVLDKDPKKPLLGSRPPTFMTWGRTPVIFKGCDAGSLGELILADGPGPLAREAMRSQVGVLQKH
jgi:RNA polymerase sigma factor (sigma-70 family)